MLKIKGRWAYSSLKNRLFLTAYIVNYSSPGYPKFDN